MLDMRLMTGLKGATGILDSPFHLSLNKVSFCPSDYVRVPLRLHITIRH